MQVGDLIVDKRSGHIGIVVKMDLLFDLRSATDEREPYCRCLIRGDHIWLFESDLELICK